MTSRQHWNVRSKAVVIFKYNQESQKLEQDLKLVSRNNCMHITATSWNIVIPQLGTKVLEQLHQNVPNTSDQDIILKPPKGSTSLSLQIFKKNP